MNTEAQIALIAGEEAKPIMVPARVAAAGIVASNQLTALADVLENLDHERTDEQEMEAILTGIAGRIRSLAQVTYCASSPGDISHPRELVRKLKGY